MGRLTLTQPSEYEQLRHMFQTSGHDSCQTHRSENFPKKLSKILPKIVRSSIIVENIVTA
jgi:hypothetical protein